MEAHKIFSIKTQSEFETEALSIFRFQIETNPVYREFCRYLNKNTDNVRHFADIPFLPIEFFKSKKVIVDNVDHEIMFTSSGTTGNQTSKHYVNDLKLYETSYLKSFEIFYGAVSEFCILALLPSYLDRRGSSLIYMMDDLIKKSKNPESGFYLNDLPGLADKLRILDAKGNKILLVGVTFALLDLIEKHDFRLKNTIIMETGGMKGRRKELIREELHTLLKKGFGVDAIHSEYGMTELLSQAYSKGNGVFWTPPWMKIQVRDTEDPLADPITGKTGGINITDLANLNSCSFIATQDLGKVHEDGSFEVLGRFDHSDIRGCNLMAL
ncbi:acyl transferase [Maribacter algicola]|uniref:Acyl transferase n=1 Tax=Meishania litoralis TaxID=3434685 RepID=A0ACC7LPC4_9FLAO